jgi:hypothetical protein
VIRAAFWIGFFLTLGGALAFYILAGFAVAGGLLLLAMGKPLSGIAFIIGGALIAAGVRGLVVTLQREVE